MTDGITTHRITDDRDARLDDLPPPKLGTPSNILPPDARVALLAASQTIDAKERAAAVELAIRSARSKYPHLFQERK